MPKKSKTKVKKSELKKSGRDKTTVKRKKSSKATAPKATTHAAAVPTYAPHGSVDVARAAPTSKAVIVAGSSNRFFLRPSPHKNADGPMMELIDKASKKLLVRFFLHMNFDPIWNIFEARLHDVCGNTPIELLSGPQQQKLTNILRAIEYTAIAMF